MHSQQPESNDLDLNHICGGRQNGGGEEGSLHELSDEFAVFYEMLKICLGIQMAGTVVNMLPDMYKSECVMELERRSKAFLVLHLQCSVIIQEETTINRHLLADDFIVSLSSHFCTCNNLSFKHVIN